MTIKRFGITVGLLVCGLCFWVPQNAQAVALAESSISFTNLQITSRDPAGTVELFSDWYMEAYAEARNSLGGLSQQFSSSTSPDTITADAAVTWAYGHGDATALGHPPDFDVQENAATLVLIPDHIKDAYAASQGRGALLNTLKVTTGTGTGLVEVDFSGIVDYFLHVQTTNNGVYAETVTIFALEVFGLPLVNGIPQNPLVLFFRDSLEIGPDSEALDQDSAPLSGTRFLKFGELYDFWLESDSESFAEVPEPSTIALMLLSLGILAGFVRKQCLTTRFVKSNSL